MSNVEIIGNGATPATWKPAVHKGESRMDLSKQWMARPSDQRYLDLASLHARTKAIYDASKNQVIDLKRNPKSLTVLTGEDMNLDDRHSLGVMLDEKAELLFSHHTFSQVATLANAPSSYLRTLHPALVSDNLNYGLRVNRKVDGLAVYHAEGMIRAATGPDYGRIPDFEVVEAVQAFTA